MIKTKCWYETIFKSTTMRVKSRNHCKSQHQDDIYEAHTTGKKSNNNLHHIFINDASLNYLSSL